MITITIEDGNKIRQVSGESCIVLVGDTYRKKGKKEFCVNFVLGTPVRLKLLFIHLFSRMPKMIGLAAIAIDQIRRN